MITETAGHRRRLTLQRLMLPAEIIPSHEQRWDGRVKAQALAVTNGWSRRMGWPLGGKPLIASFSTNHVLAEVFNCRPYLFPVVVILVGQVE